MSRTIACLSIAAMVAVALTVGTGLAAAGGDKTPKEANGKVEVCHVPPGNPGNAHLISIWAKGWENGHKNHEQDFRTYGKKSKQHKCEKLGEKKYKKHKH